MTTRRSLRLLVSLSLLLALLGIAQAAAASPAVVPRAQASPSLRAISVAGYARTIEGVNWPHRVRLVFTVALGSTPQPPMPGAAPGPVTPAQVPFVRGLELRATRGGTFLVGINGIGPCGGWTITARDFKGHRIELAQSPHSCPPPVSTAVTQVSLVLLGGTLQHPRFTPLLPRTGTGPVTVVLGNGVSLAATTPGWVPSTDARYLAPYSTGISFPGGSQPPRGAPIVQRPGRFSWQWIAIKVGTTFVWLSPSCRQVKPPCEAPSLGIPVRIVRR